MILIIVEKLFFLIKRSGNGKCGLSLKMKSMPTGLTPGHLGHKISVKLTNAQVFYIFIIAIKNRLSQCIISIINHPSR
jgi:hypothetical protein